MTPIEQRAEALLRLDADTRRAQLEQIARREGEWVARAIKDEMRKQWEGKQ